MKILQLVLAILGTLLLPLVLVCLIPFFIYRWVVAILYPILSREILKIVSTSSSVFAILIKEYHVMSNILITINLDNGIAYEDLLKAVSERMIEAKDTRGQALYPELTHHIVGRFGHFFWKKDSNFDIKDHVQLLTEPLNFGFKNSFMVEFFDQEKSPWKMLLVDSGKEILFKFHHSLGDGYSLLNTLMSCTDDTLVRNQPKSTDIPLWKTFFFPILALYEILTFSGGSPSPLGETLEMSHTRVFSKSRSLSKGIITERAKKLNASFTAILLGALGVGIQRILKQENVPIRASTMDACVPFRSYSKLKKLDNTFGTAYLRIPITLGFEETVKAIDESIRVAKNSTFPKIVQLMYQLSSLLTTRSILWALPSMQIYYSPIQGPKNPLYLNGIAVFGFHFQMNLYPTIPLSLNSITYQGNLEYTLSGANKIFTNQMLEDLSDFICKELSRLESN